MISTTITQKNFDLKMKDLDESGFFIEYKEQKPFWNTRLRPISNNLSNHDGLNIPINFLVGQKSHKFNAISIWLVHHDFIPERYVDVIKTEFAYAIKCVDQYVSKTKN